MRKEPCPLQTRFHDSLQKRIDQQNIYLVDKIAFMRQWPFFYDVSGSPENAFLFKEEKVAFALPPVGGAAKRIPLMIYSIGHRLNCDAANEFPAFSLAADANQTPVEVLSSTGALPRVSRTGLEPVTKGLKGPCSTT